MTYQQFQKLNEMARKDLALYFGEFSWKRPFEIRIRWKSLLVFNKGIFVFSRSFDSCILRTSETEGIFEVLAVPQ